MIYKLKQANRVNECLEHIYSLFPSDSPIQFSCSFTDSFNHLFIEQTFIGHAHAFKIQK